jgi:hypothetical protein
MSCEKKRERVKVIKNITDVDEMFQLKNYKQEVKLKTNDSINRITATDGNFILTGDFDTKMNAKTGIWSLKNTTDTKEIQIDYIIFGKNDVFKNQIIFKEYNKIDSSVSKFYIKEKTPKELVLSFFSPKTKDEISKEAKIWYSILRNSKEIKRDSILYKNMKMKEGKYRINIEYDFKKGDNVKGYFGESVLLTSPKNKDSITMGDNTIYFKENFE